MSAVSTFMAALKHATDSDRNSESTQSLQGDGSPYNSAANAQISSTTSRESERSISPKAEESVSHLHTPEHLGSSLVQAAPEKSYISPSQYLSDHQHRASNIETAPPSSSSGPAESIEISVESPQLRVSNSIDDLFSDGEDDFCYPDRLQSTSDDMEGGHYDREGSKEPTSAVDGDLLSTKVGAHHDDSIALSLSEYGIKVRDFAILRASFHTLGTASQGRARDFRSQGLFPDYVRLNMYQEAGQPHLDNASQLIGCEEDGREAEKRESTFLTNPDFLDHFRKRQGKVTEGGIDHADINDQDLKLEIKERMEEVSTSNHGMSGKVDQSQVVSEVHLTGSGVALGDRTQQNLLTPHLSSYPPKTSQSRPPEAETKGESGFSQALQALEDNSFRHLGWEMDLDNGHGKRLQEVSRRRGSDALCVALTSAEDAHPGAEDESARQGREASPAPMAPLTSVGQQVEIDSAHQNRTDAENVTDDDMGKSSSLALSEEGDERSKIRIPGAHDAPTTHFPFQTTTQIPGLTYFGRTKEVQDPMQQEILQPLMSPPIDQAENTDVDSVTDIRKSIEPETPHRFLKRDCTPAFEARSPSPSPRSTLQGDRNDDDIDIEMGDTSSPGEREIKEDAREKDFTGISPSSLGPDISNPPAPASFSPKHASDTLKNVATASASVPPKSPPTIVTLKPRLTPSSQNRKRRKSAVQGSGIKIEKHQPKSRNVSRKLTGSGACATTSSNATATRKGKGVVKEAVEKIEANLNRDNLEDANGHDNTTVGCGRAQGGGRRNKSGMETMRRTATPPTRKSKRLMQKRGETPEVD